jgi:signal transduction histidine kinase
MRTERRHGRRHIQLGPTLVGRTGIRASLIHVDGERVGGEHHQMDSDAYVRGERRGREGAADSAEQARKRAERGRLRLDDDWRLVVIEGCAERLFDQPVADLLGESLWDRLPTATRETFRPQFEHAAGTGVAVTFVDRDPPLDTETRLEVSARPSPMGLDVTIRDLDAAATTTSGRAGLEAFGDVLAHDLATPLSTVEGRLELARRTGEEAHLEEASGALTRVWTLVEDLADALREGTVVTEVRPVDLDGLARSVWDGLETEGPGLETAFSKAVYADECALSRLLQNLFQNALDHAGPATRVTLGKLADGDGFYIEDDGPGIPAEDREYAFEPGHSTAPEGSGVGLFSVRQVARGHGWTVTLAEAASGGARFEIRGVERVADPR